MKKFAWLFLVGALTGLRGLAAPASTDQSGYRETVELRDGSRVMGQSVEDSLGVHSATLGDLKLPWPGIRTIEYAADPDKAHLTAINGDSFTVQLSADTLRLKTEFGNTDLPVKLIRSIKVSSSPRTNAFGAPGAVDETKLRLAMALWDGSRVVGKGLDDTLVFHSGAMGDLKLPWSGIRSIVYASPGADTARLTAANGDVYQVQFSTPTVKVESKRPAGCH